MDQTTAAHQTRLDAALARLEAKAEADRARRERAADPAAQAALDQALADERAAGARLAERLGALHRRQQGVIDRLAARLTLAQQGLARAGAAIDRLTAANAELTAANRALSGKARLGQGADPLLAACQAEIAALQAARLAEVTLIEDTLAAMDDLIAAAPNPTPNPDATKEDSHA
ncbi:hypothetical protein ACEYYB_03540 [Paracoccus sp. p4-l81]|uniref:hypothetical protein n=1 Tax=Paracoccus sp. p4-l81 TaxID=3342806 RepID=UPI0035B8115E